MTLKITVLGIPVTQGSKTAFIAGNRAHVREKNPMRFADWRQAVRSEAQRVMGYQGHQSWLPGGIWDRPIVVECHFSLLKPASAPKTRRTWPIGARSGDIDKLSRLVLDALTGIVFADDSHVVELHATKDYGVPGVEILVSAVTVGEPTQ